jgi:glutamate 5-kinase
VVPIVNENDTVAVRELACGDNDFLASQLLNLVEADLFVNLTSAKGVFATNPDLDPQAECLDCIEDMAGLDVDAMCGAKTGMGSGGMHSKLLAARRAAQLGVPTLIRAFAGERLGTLVLPESRKVPSRKYWLAYHAEPAGNVVVDQGAARALMERGKSLLPAGIVEVEGDFDQGEPVRVKAVDGRTLGVGLANYKAEDLRRIRGRKTSEIEALLGYCYPEAVHRDNLLFDAAL